MRGLLNISAAGGRNRQEFPPYLTTYEALSGVKPYGVERCAAELLVFFDDIGRA